MKHLRLTKVKAILRSLLISSTNKTTIKKLNQAYLDTEGEHIPFKQLGYASIEKFLRDIPDTLEVFGRGPSAKVYPLPNNKYNYIQKKSSKKTRHCAKKKSKSSANTRNRSKCNKKCERNSSGHQLPLLQYNDNYQHVSNSRISWTKSDMQKAFELRSRLDHSSAMKMIRETEFKTEEIVIKFCQEIKQLIDPNNGVEEDEAVPDYDVESDIFQLNLADIPLTTFGKGISASKIPEYVSENHYLLIRVSEVHNPYKFWFQIWEENSDLDLLMNQMELFYSSIGANDLCIPLDSLISGQVCAVLYDDTWYRARILAPTNNNTIKVFYMDYGRVSHVELGKIKFLPSVFAQLPAQAFRGCLCYIKPRDLHWRHEAAFDFLNLVSDKILTALIIEIDRQNQICYMIITKKEEEEGEEEKGEEGEEEEEAIEINQYLIDNGYASHHDEWYTQNYGRRLHHPDEDLPTFAMIESGQYPDSSLLCTLKEEGFNYETIYDTVSYNRALNVLLDLPYVLCIKNPFIRT